MFLDIQKIPAEGLRFDEVLHLPPLEGPAGESLRPQGVRLRGTAEPGGGGVDLREPLRAHLKAHLDAELSLSCGRCLDPVPFRIDTDLALTLVPGPAEGAEDPAEAEIEVTDDDAAVFACPEGKANLEALATEQIYLALPLKPLCASACRGLCPTCGQNLNRTSCDCHRKEIDPRMAPLLQFKKTRSGS
jgi:uncharacterized protein